MTLMMQKALKHDDGSKASQLPSAEAVRMSSPGEPKNIRTSRICGSNRQRRRKTAPLAPEILIVEDGSGLLHEFADKLAIGGFQVIFASDANTARQELTNVNIVAVIAGASREYLNGLHVLADFKQWRGEVKTLVATRLVQPELPVQAYEMEIDDYLHWPLTSWELNSRVKNLLETGGGGQMQRFEPPGHESHHTMPLTVMGSLVEGFTRSLALISQSLEDIRQRHQKDRGESLAAELLCLAGQIQKLGEIMQRCRQLGAVAEPAGVSPGKRLH